MPTKSKTRKAPAAPEAATAHARLTDLHFTEEIETMKRGCLGLRTAVTGANHESCGELDGVVQLACDLADGMERLAESFEAERRFLSFRPRGN